MASSSSADADKEPANEELSKLLDDALGDFDRIQSPPASTTDDDLDDLMSPLDREATQRAANKFQVMLESMLKASAGAPGTSPTSEEAGSSSADAAGVDDDFADVLNQFMAKTGDVANAGDEKTFLEAFKKLEDDSDPAMDGIMNMVIRTTLSREIMHPTVRDIHAKFGPYLAENKERLDEDTLRRYRRQEQILALMCQEYEATPIDESGDNEGLASMARITHYWEQLQKEGLPPPELAGSLPAEAGASANAMGNCCLM